VHKFIGNFEHKRGTTYCSFSGIGKDDRLSAEEMDNLRDQATAYEYLCHLEEAKQ